MTNYYRPGTLLDTENRSLNRSDKFATLVQFWIFFGIESTIITYPKQVITVFFLLSTLFSLWNKENNGEEESEYFYSFQTQIKYISSNLYFINDIWSICECIKYEYA